ncbi:hypothetical protein PF005_g12954 [Phytophthora fragariae]|uniref:Uncharacterized protein n=1 Tax=Phytophthora fragariae TaxID=53985 RepID=A0A6A3XS87_9STRA|nr:hypothetical protein PF003_g15802 [Phytophthora fragariae]KAE8935628.1 hypothetical protein PF009_g14435 [Phytophthora fragariae]KAE8994542.1 hypothetical protein PF011_g16692 [Phytophthora fragariae]KAE9088417.1 hypothetical protein PF007_g19978 [Phytophthora fragariae]KAE9088455.1 hypothetical protein PF010_g19374 [Phytophthora fragariae]
MTARRCRSLLLAFERLLAPLAPIQTASDRLPTMLAPIQTASVAARHQPVTVCYVYGDGSCDDCD